MGRHYIDCREVPTLALSADTEDELESAAAQHAVAVHGHQDTPELRAEIRKAMHAGNPPA